MRFQPTTTPIEETPTVEGVREVVRRSRWRLDRLGVTGIGVFGSVARGEAGPDSDVDLAIGTSIEFDLMHRAAAGRLLAHRLGRPVDVTSLPLWGFIEKCAADDLVMVR